MRYFVLFPHLEKLRKPDWWKITAISCENAEINTVAGTMLGQTTML